MSRQDSAELLALRALTWLTGNEDLLPVFMNASGLAPDDLARGARDPAFLGSVLDFLLMDDSWIVAFCDAHGLRYDQPMQARQALPGGEAINWT